MYQRFKTLLLTVILLIVFSSINFNSLALAQVGATSSNISGVISDEQGAKIKGALISITNVATNFKRDTTTSENGEYNLTQLPPGEYEVSISADGFRNQTFRLSLELGTVAKLSPSLALGQVGDVVVIEGGTSGLEEGKTESSTNQDRSRIDNLPINRRNFLDFALTSPRTTLDRLPQVGATPTSGISFNGYNARANNITIDGLSNNDNYTRAVRTTFSQDAVQEFQIVSDNFSAEFGRASGGVVNIVTKGGSNTFHGSLFSFIRNDATSGRDVFVKTAPEYKQYQFGGTFSGPIKKDKVLFFGSFERLSIRQNTVVTISDALVKSINNVGFPVRNGSIPFALGTTSALARTDIRLNQNDNLIVRYNGGFKYDGAFETFNNVLGGLTSDTASGVSRIEDNSVAVTNIYVNPAANLTNETRFLYGRRSQNSVPTVRGLPLTVVNAPEGQIAFGQNVVLPQQRDETTLQFINNVGIVRGKNQLKFGVDFISTSFPGDATFFLRESGQTDFVALNFAALLGDPTFPTIPALQAFDPRLRTPDQLAFLSTLTTLLPAKFAGFPRNLPIASLSIPRQFVQTFGKNNYSVVGRSFSAFAQDDIKVNSKFLLKLGVRYDINRARFYPDNNGYFAPRVAFAYNVVPRVNIRGSYGLYFDGPPSLAFAFAVRETTAKDFTVLALPFPFSIIPFAQPTHNLPRGNTVPSGVPVIPQLSRVLNFDKNSSNSYSQQAVLGIDYLLGSNTTLSVSYAFVRGLKIPSLRNINNVVRPVPGNPVLSAITGRVDPTKGQTTEYETAFDSYYHAVSLVATRRLSKDFSFLASYTLSKSIDNFIDIRADLVSFNNSLRVDLERGLSLQDTRHRFVGSGTWSLNYAKNPILSGFDFSTIVTLESGKPYNLVAGADLNLDGELGDRPRVGGVAIGRNTGILPGFASVDVRLTRTVKFKENISVQGFFEIFNLFNRVNISQINNLFPPDAQGKFNLPSKQDGLFSAPPSRFTGAFSPRQCQFGFRLKF